MSTQLSNSEQQKVKEILNQTDELLKDFRRRSEEIKQQILDERNSKSNDNQ